MLLLLIKYIVIILKSHHFCVHCAFMMVAYMVGSLLTKWVANDHPSFHKDSKMSRCNGLWLKLLFLEDGFIFLAAMWIHVLTSKCT